MKAIVDFMMPFVLVEAHEWPFLPPAPSCAKLLHMKAVNTSEVNHAITELGLKTCASLLNSMQSACMVK